MRRCHDMGMGCGCHAWSHGGKGRAVVEGDRHAGALLDARAERPGGAARPGVAARAPRGADPADTLRAVGAAHVAAGRRALIVAGGRRAVRWRHW